MNERLKSLIYLLIFLSVSDRGVCQDSTLIRQMLLRISSSQQHHNKDFPAGMIPSYRASARRKDILKNDDNIFYTGLVVFTLRYLYPSLDPAAKNICDSIFSRATPLYRRHQNNKGRFTYNYWQTDKPEIFPNGGLLNLFNKSQALPDDMDVTSIILLAENANDTTVVQVHKLMQDYTNQKYKQVKSTLPIYKKFPAYSTWFGKKMPIDFDFGVMTNILYLVNKYQLPYTPADSASLNFLYQVVAHRDYMNHAAIISPSYNRPAVLLYHLARLMGQSNIASLEKYKQQLIKDATTLYKHSSNFFDKIILSTSLMRWGVILPDEQFIVHKNWEEFINDNSFVFFVANIASMLPTPFNTLLGKTGIGKFYYYCPAYNYVLLIENMVMRQKNSEAAITE